MASIAKFKSNSHGMLLKHNNRTPGDGCQHGNEEIDDSLTQYNYHLKFGTAADIDKRLSEVFNLARSNQVTLCEVVVTLPKDVKPQDERLFFRSVYDFYKNDFGEENIINAVVHKDETTPHIHIDFVPVIKDVDNTFTFRSERAYGIHMNALLNRWKAEHPGTLERLSCSELIKHSYLMGMHERLSRHCMEQLGYYVSVMNGATEKGNKTIQTLKLETLQAEVARLEQQRLFLNEDIRKINELARRSGLKTDGLDLMPLMNTIADLKNQNQVMQDIIRRNGCTYTKQDLERMQVSRDTILAQSTNINVFDKALSGMEFEKNAVIITETYYEHPRPSRQEELFRRNRELAQLLSSAQREPGTIVRKDSPLSDRICYFVKADNEQQTMMRILELERLLREENLKDRRIYMSRIEYDRYDLARSMLSALNAEVYYCIGEDKTDKPGEEKSLSIYK